MFDVTPQLDFPGGMRSNESLKPHQRHTNINISTMRNDIVTQNGTCTPSLKNIVMNSSGIYG